MLIKITNVNNICFKIEYKIVMVTLTCNHSTQNTEARGLSFYFYFYWLLRLHSDFQEILIYSVNPMLYDNTLVCCKDLSLILI